MKIDGTDPLILNKLKDSTFRPEVQRLGDVETDNKILEKQAKAQGKPRAAADKPYMEELEGAVMQANETADAFNLGLRFKLHEATDRIMVQVVNIADNEVVKEIPPERILNLMGQIQEMIGVLLDEKR